MVEKKIDNRRDILLLMLYTPGSINKINVPIVGRTRLVKMLFLFKEEVLDQFIKDTNLDLEKYYEFIPWHFGPFSANVYNDLRFFELREFIFVEFSKEETLSEAAEEWVMWLLTANSLDTQNQYSEYEEVSFNLTKKGCSFVENELYSHLSRNQKKILQYFRGKYEGVPLRAILKYVYEKYPDFSKTSLIRDEVVGN